MNRTAARTLDMLEYFSALQKPVGISDISRDMNMPKSSTFDILYTLVEKGYIEVDNEALKTFRLGLKMFQIGSVAVKKSSLYKTAHPFLENLKGKTGETVYLAVEDGGKVIYIDRVDGDSPIRSTCQVGSNNLMHLTGLGKAMLAAFEQKKVKSITGGGALAVRTGNTISSYDRLLRELDKIREKGYAEDNGEDNENVYCIAAPVYDMNNQPVAAISISILMTGANKEKRELLSSLAVDTAMSISKKLGSTKQKTY